MTWRHFAMKTLPRVVLELGLPAATRQPCVDRCPRHDEPLNAVTHLCESCFQEAWGEVRRRYAAQGRPAQPQQPKGEHE
jgi:hypothetical protein